MGRRKIEIKAIKDDRNRSVTFLKRKGGLFKKAHELSVLCSVDVAVIIFGNNKKLYEYSSSDIGEILQRYNYYGQPNEHKGPADFNGKKDDDDDDDDDMGSPPSHHSQEPPILPPQYQNQNPAFQHIRHHTPSASPPVQNGVPFNIQRQHTPQPQQLGSRPSSRNAARRTSSNLGPQHMSGPPPGANGYAYMPQPGMPQPGMPQQGMPQQGMYPPPNGPGIPPHGHQQLQHPQMHAPMPQAPLQQGHMQGPPTFQYSGPPPQHPQHPQQQHLQPQYIDEQRRSMPPAFPQQEQIMQRSPQPPPQQLPSQPSPQPPHQEEPPNSSSQMLQAPVKRMSKSRSIFTPIDESRSILSQHWASSTSAPESMSLDAATGRAQSVDVGAVARQNGAAPSPPIPTRAQTHDKHRNISQSSIPDTTFTPPSRTNSAQLGVKRPRLKVQIPDEPSDGGSNTAGSSPPGSTATGTNAPRTEGSHSSSGVVLPPPSPSAGALLSAGASGPPNPFARPHPPQNAQSQADKDRKDNIETPMSALPSRFMSNEFLPSPSSFFNPDYGMWRNDGNTLPSPMNFSTPVMGFGASFLREDSGGASAGGANSSDVPNPGKRKSPDIKIEPIDAKRPKTEG